eukprot:SAG22_NODE_95_length_20791_cov_40.318514_14_plen_333_part_00
MILTLKACERYVCGTSAELQAAYPEQSQVSPPLVSSPMSPPADAPCADPVWVDPVWVPAGSVAPEEFMWLDAESDEWGGPWPAGSEATTAGWYCAHPNPCADVYMAEATCDIREVLALAGELVAGPGYAPATDDPRLAVYCACRAVMSSSDARPVAAASCTDSEEEEEEEEGRTPGTVPALWAAVLMNTSVATAAAEVAAAAAAAAAVNGSDTATAAAFVAAAANSTELITCPTAVADRGADFIDGNRTLDYRCSDDGEIDNEDECNRAGADGCIDTLGDPCHWERVTCYTYVGYFRAIWWEELAGRWWDELPGVVETLDACCRPPEQSDGG